MLLIYVLGGSCQRNIGLIFNLATIHEGVTPSNLPRYKMVNGLANGNQTHLVKLIFALMTRDKLLSEFKPKHYFDSNDND